MRKEEENSNVFKKLVFTLVKVLKVIFCLVHNLYFLKLWYLCFI